MNKKFFHQPIKRRNFLFKAAVATAGFAMAGIEAAVWFGKWRGLQEKIQKVGILSSNLPPNERALITAWSIFDWRDVESAEGMEKAVELYKDEFRSGNIAPAFNGFLHKGMAEYLKDLGKREAKSKLYGPYNVFGERSIRRFSFNKETNSWQLKQRVPY